MAKDLAYRTPKSIGKNWRTINQLITTRRWKLDLADAITQGCTRSSRHTSINHKIEGLERTFEKHTMVLKRLDFCSEREAVWVLYHVCECKYRYIETYTLTIYGSFQIYVQFIHKVATFSLIQLLFNVIFPLTFWFTYLFLNNFSLNFSGLVLEEEYWALVLTPLAICTYRTGFNFLNYMS